MHQEDEGYEHPRDEHRVHQITLPPAILGDEPRAPRRQEEGADARAGQSETGSEPAPALKPPGHQHDMWDEAQSSEAGADKNTIVEVKLPQRRHAATEEKSGTQEHRR